MPQNTTSAEIVQDCPMPKDWMQIRIEKDTGKLLDEIHVARRESYNDIILRLIEYWKTTHDKE